MKKLQVVLYLVVVILLLHVMFVVGCGRNPFVSVLGGGNNVNVGVGKL